MLVIRPNFWPAEVASVFIALEAFKVVDFWSDFLIYWVKSYDRGLDLVKSYYGYLAGFVKSYLGYGFMCDYLAYLRQFFYF